MNEMRKLMEVVERAQSGTPVTESEMKTYKVKYTVTVNLPVKAEDQDEAEEKFFDYLFSNELQMDHNFGLDLGEVTITPMDLKTYKVKYTVTVNLPVKAEDEEQAEEKFFDYLFENELQMDHNFGLDLGEVTITPMDLGEASETDNTKAQAGELPVLSEAAEPSEVARELEDIYEQLKELVDSANSIVDQSLAHDSPARGRARYWISALESALDDQHQWLGGNMFTMLDTIEELQHSDDELQEVSKQAHTPPQQ